ncbi:hypothetical protein ACFCV3_22275 [Kribbella sp. NPDC056345]|uniref:hypothetical protein n=1 Tax=Kribbella sp. NPDC056345 TaxID=3345789 RepID=UPI0035D6CBD6
MTTAEDQLPDDQEVDYDFDEAWRERKAARVAPKIRILGKVYTLPHSLPAKLILFAVSAQKNGRSASDEVTAEEAFDMLSALLGEENLVDILNRGLEIDDLPDVLGTCQQVYKNRQAAPGNGVAPAKGATAPAQSG